MTGKWKIEAVTCSGPNGYKWQWMKATHAGKILEQSCERFDYYYECVVDAQKHGFQPPEVKNRAYRYNLR
jgi:hypothetical protein